jgi:ATP-dependent Clp protease ATP-binding subunit ClpA
MVNRIFGANRQLRGQAPRETALSVIRRSEIEAKKDRAKFIEAEHMLLALAMHSESGVGRLLNESGLDHIRLASLLRDEHRRSLAFAGVGPLDEKQAEATELDSSLSLGTSAKAAIKRAMLASRADRPRRLRFESTDLLVGILGAELGTVPRAMAIAGVDRAALISRARGSE